MGPALAGSLDLGSPRGPSPVRLFDGIPSRNKAIVLPEVGLSLNASFMYAGFALGAALGSIVISVASVLWIGAAGAICVAAAALWSHRIWLRQVALVRWSSPRPN